MNTPAGQVIDTFGARTPMIVGLFLQGLAPFGYIIGLYPEYVPVVGAAGIFIAARILWGFGSAFVFVGAYSIVVHVTEQDNRGTWIGYFRGGQALGFPSGLILGGVLTDLFGYEVAFAVSGASGVVAAIVAAAVLPTVRQAAHRPAPIRAIPAIVRRDVRIFIIGSVNFTVRFLFAGILLSTLVLYAEAHEIGIGDFTALGASGFLMAVAVIASSMTTVIAGAVSDNVDDRAIVPIPALGLFIAGFAILGFVPTLTAVVVAVVLIGIGVGGTNPPLLAYLGDISPEGDIGKMGGIYNVFGDLGSALGPLVALPVGAAIGYQLEYLLSAVMATLLLLLIVLTLLCRDVESVAPRTRPMD